MSELIDNFASRLTKAITVRNIKPSELAEKTGIDKSKISSYMSGRYKAKQDGIYLLSQALKIDPAWLMGYDVPMEEMSANDKWKTLGKYMEENNLTSLKILPVYGIIKAGEPTWAEQNIIGHIPFDSSLYDCSDNEDYFYLKVDGESMNQVIRNGDFALIQKQSTAENGDIIVALVNGYDATLKRFKRINNQFVSLEPMSNDTSFESITVDLKTTNFLILGKFVGYFGKYKIK